MSADHGNGRHAPSEFLEQLVYPFQDVRFYRGPEGYIVWRRGTGHNVELLHLKASEEGKGYGLALLKKMLWRLKTNPPYWTVFGFTRSCNEVAQRFYREAGFRLSPVLGVYADGHAMLFSAPYAELVKLHLRSGDDVR